MKRKIAIIVLGCLYVLNIQAQDSSAQKQRLDFAKMYFEGGGSYMPSFTGQQLINGQLSSFEHSETLNPYLTWGAFHFWGHTEFYVTFPLNQLTLNKNDQTGHQLLHSVATGARIYPWAMREGIIRPYIGVNWGALELKQKLKPDENQPTLSKDIMLNYDAGVLYNYKKIAVRLGINYFADNKWQYPVSTTQMTEIETPRISFQMGLLYTFDASKDNTKENIDKWNSYPRVSKLSFDAKKFGDFFIGIGPSLSFSLAKSDYNATQFPYLKQKITSTSYFDIAVGYHFNKANFFTAISYRNPIFETEGFGSKQTIKKTSVALEINKFLTDYSGFAPYIGLNVAYDKLNYEHNIDGIIKKQIFTNAIEPGITLGWDIVPGKTSEALILRTNLRWYPFSKFELDGEKFNFSQLEYNLIQLVFYPERLKLRKK
jgi:outer membrane protein W